MHNADLSLTEISKVEGAASLNVKVKNGKVAECKFTITEFKRFYTQAMRGKHYAALPQFLSRVCGTCSNAHILCSIESCEKALGITPTPQSMTMKKLTISGLNIRDHALHLYLFALPDIYGIDAFLDLDENNPEQHQILHDAFEIKEVGNFLATIIAGRSVHGLYPTVGGFLQIPKPEDVATAIKKLKDVRPAVLRTIKIFENCKFNFDNKTHYMALTCNPFGFLEGEIKNDIGEVIQEADYRDHLERVIIPYSQASGYRHEGESFMVGSLARLNLSKDTLHENTKKDAASALVKFPSTNIFDNNLAQAVEILHGVDVAIDLLETTKFKKEALAKPTRKSGVGIGVIEAPRGTLYHKVSIGEDGVVLEGEIIVPTGQNQINIERDIARLIEELIEKDLSKEDIQFEMEKLIRAYDPCMSCAAHFLKVNWS